MCDGLGATFIALRSTPVAEDSAVGLVDRPIKRVSVGPSGLSRHPSGQSPSSLMPPLHERWRDLAGGGVRGFQTGPVILAGAAVTGRFFQAPESVARLIC